MATSVSALQRFFDDVQFEAHRSDSELVARDLESADLESARVPELRVT